LELAPVGIHNANLAGATASATQKSAVREFAKTVQQAGSGAVAGKGADEQSLAPKAHSSKVCARGERNQGDQHQGGQHNSGNQTRRVGDVLVTFTDGQVSRRVSVGGNETNAAMGSQSQKMQAAVMRQDTASQMLPSPAQALPTAAHVFLTMPRLADSRIIRPGETAKSGSRVSSDFSGAETTPLLHVETVISGQEDPPDGHNGNPSNPETSPNSDDVNASNRNEDGEEPGGIDVGNPPPPTNPPNRRTSNPDEPEEPADDALPVKSLKPQIGTQYGSNLGGVHHDGDGNTYYVKYYKNFDQARVEVLSSKLFEALGVRTIGPELAMVNAKQAVVTAWNSNLNRLDLSGFNALNADQRNQLSRTYMAAVLTKNWDVVGLVYDNLMLDSQSNDLVALDTGGSFHFRARGGHKEYDGNISELNTLRQPDKPVGRVYSQLFVEHPETEKSAVEAVRNLDVDDLRLVFKASGLSNWENLYDAFKQRRSALIDHYAVQAPAETNRSQDNASETVDAPSPKTATNASLEEPDDVYFDATAIPAARLADIRALISGGMPRDVALLVNDMIDLAKGSTPMHSILAEFGPLQKLLGGKTACELVSAAARCTPSGTAGDLLNLLAWSRNFAQSCLEKGHVPDKILWAAGVVFDTINSLPRYSLSYNENIKDMTRLANTLLSHGLAPDDIVASIKRVKASEELLLISQALGVHQQKFGLDGMATNEKLLLLEKAQRYLGELDIPNLSSLEYEDALYAVENIIYGYEIEFEPNAGLMCGIFENAPTHHTNSDMRALAVRMANGVQLSKDEVDSLEYYQKKGYEIINGFLRSNESPDIDTATKIVNINMAITKHSLPEPIVVYRGLVLDDLSELFGGRRTSPDELQGITLIDDAFMSSSTNPIISINRVNKIKNELSKPVFMEIKLPEGTHCCILRHYTKWEYHENEILLPRGTRMQIVKAEEIDGNLVLRMELTP
jgi:hypothetical protein